MFPMDWITGSAKKLEEERQKSNQEIVLWRETSQSLAASIEQLCGLCDDLIDVIYQMDGLIGQQNHIIDNLPAKVESIRKCASYINSEANLPGSAGVFDIDPYSLKELRDLLR